MTPSAFRTYFQSYADQVAAGTGLSAGLFLAQWAVETAYASAFAGSYNLGNITRGGASNGFVNYGSYAQFVNAQILLLHDVPYEGVLASAGKSLAEQCVALGSSPWDAGHYNNGGGPGSSLIAVLPLFGFSAEQIGDADLTPQEHAWLENVTNEVLEIKNELRGSGAYSKLDEILGLNGVSTAANPGALAQAEADLKSAIASIPAPQPGQAVDLSPVTAAIAALKAEVDDLHARVSKDLA